MLSTRLFALVSLLTLVQGCAYYSARPFDSRQEASSIVEQKEAEGLYVAVKDISHPRDSMKYFDRDLRSYDYVPVMVLLELDHGAQGVFDVRREDVHLCLRDGRRLGTADPDAVAQDVGFSHGRAVLGYLLIIPGFFITSSVSEANEQLATDYDAKALKSVRINPNLRSYRAVVFFQIPSEIERSFTMDDAFVEVKVNRRGEGTAMGKSMEFPVHFGR